MPVTANDAQNFVFLEDGASVGAVLSYELKANYLHKIKIKLNLTTSGVFPMSAMSWVNISFAKISNDGFLFFLV